MSPSCAEDLSIGSNGLVPVTKARQSVYNEGLVLIHLRMWSPTMFAILSLLLALAPPGREASPVTVITAVACRCPIWGLKLPSATIMAALVSVGG